MELLSTCQLDALFNSLRAGLQMFETGPESFVLLWCKECTVNFSKDSF